MFLILFIATLCIAGSLGNPIHGEKIVNGTDASENEFPYIVSLKNYGSHNCGGSILDATHVLTASHCIVNPDPSTLKVQYGMVDITTHFNLIDVRAVVTHEKYQPGNGFHNDIAVLKLASPIPFSDAAQPTVLPPAFNATPGNQAAVLIGWGRDSSSGDMMTHLQKVDIKVYTDADCKAAHGSVVDEKYHVCAGIPEGGKGQCNGDSGGPLTVNGVQVGISSWSITPCGIKGYPGVFCKVANYVDWINDKIANM